MNTVSQILLDDRKTALMRQVNQAAGRDSLVVAFASYWIPVSDVLKNFGDKAISAALAAKGAARTYRDVAILGYAVASGNKQSELQTAFTSGLSQLTGREFDIGGMHSPVCDDCLALLGLTLGASVIDSSRQFQKWLIEACRISSTRNNQTSWDRAVTELAGKLARRAEIHSLSNQPLFLAAHARGLLTLKTDIDEVSLPFLKSFLTSNALADEEAVLAIAAIEWLHRSTPAIDLKAPSIQTVCTLLNRMNASLHRWVFEEHARTINGIPRQWNIDNEYHVQSLLWAVLAPVFPELKEEEWLASVGQKKPRADLSLIGLRLIIEVKFMRHGSKVQDLIGEVAQDASLYLANGSPYSSIIVFVWDDSSSTDQHHVMAQGMKSLGGIIDVIILSRPSRFGMPMSAIKRISKNK